MNRSSVFVFALGASALAACSSLGDAFTAHVDVVAKAASQELSVTRLSDLLGKAKIGLPVNKEVATLLARDLWVPYQLLGNAAAHGDSLSDTKAIDAAASAMLENARLGRFMETVAKTFSSDTGSQASYLAGKGDLYSARHILFMLPANASAGQKDSVRKVAEGVRKQVTDANFAELAQKYSGDNTKDRGGNLGVFPRGVMVKPFGDALGKLAPGQISPLVETQFGYHIIQRNTWDRAKTEYAAQAGGHSRQVAESTYISQIQQTSGIALKSDAATTAKDVAKDVVSHLKDDHVVATYKGGTLTAGHLALVLMSAPQSARLTQQIVTAPDSLVNMYVTNMVQREVLLHRADSAKIVLGAEEMNGLHRDFVQAVLQSWQALGIDPKSLADSAKTVDARERLAAARVERYIDRVMDGTVQPLPVAAPLQIVLMQKYDFKVNPQGIDRAVERATQLRTAADSSRKAGQPQSAVPLPGAMPSTPPGAVPLPGSKP